ncbi:F-box protein cpr30 [Phtheirospermum japonicum]|uniref:F-box protein cpr30 n=1 Tax=Phtheirospermum japonicum TaxID=374723 RepID=A0A830C6X2_9LAMI|nr:F-box protein cpr30 [Phtheirospermum japonicum]
MSDVPPEIITTILIRLPVKSLLRSRCVSKPWRFLIDGQDFIKQHLRHNVETNSNRTLLGESNSNRPLVYEYTKFFYVDLDSLKRLDTGNLRSKPQYVVGSCNGLVLFLNFSNDIVLWNPSTRKLKELPATPLPPELEKSHMVADQGIFRYGLYSLGYDSKHDDYKVVRVMQVSDFIHGGFACTETKIYSLKTDSWKILEDFPYLLMHNKPRGVYLNDAVHTVVRKIGYWSDLGIVAINLVKEEHYEFPKPDFGGVSHIVASVEVIGECLAAVVVPGEMDPSGGVWVISSDVWVMKEYGVKESWCKLFRFDHSVPGVCKNLRTLGYSKSGDEFLLNDDGKRLVWYNLGKKSVRVARVEGLSDAWARVPRVEGVSPLADAWMCVESLVSPESPSAAAGVEIEKLNAQQGKKGTEIKKKRNTFLSAEFNPSL